MTVQQTRESIRSAEQHDVGLLSMSRPSVRLVNANETLFSRCLRCAVNLAVAFLIVVSPLAIAYVMYRIVGFHSLFLIINVLFLIAAMIGQLVSVLSSRRPVSENVKQSDDAIREVATS